MHRVTELIGNEYFKWKQGDRIIISTPTGSGKTVFIMRKLLLHACTQRLHVMYLCNRRALHDQSRSVLLFNIIAALQDDPKLVNRLQIEFEAYHAGVEEIATRCIQYFHVRTYQHCEVTGEYPNVTLDYDDPSQEREKSNKRKKTSTQEDQMLRAVNKNVHRYPADIMYYVFDEAHYFVCDAMLNQGIKYWDEKLKSPIGISVFLTATPEPLLCYLNRSYLTFTSLAEDLYMSKLVPNTKYYDWETNEYKWDTTARKAAKEKARDAFYQYIERSLDSEYNQKRFITYSEPADYSHITPYYFNSYDDLFDLISSSYHKTNEKWLIYVDSLRNGERLYMMLKYGIEALRNDPTSSNIAYLNADTVKNNEYNGKRVYNQIKNDQKFSCRILITTTFLDCGVNLIDSKLKNIVIANTNRTEFLQMLGRVRKTDIGINLYLKLFKINSIWPRYNRYTSVLANLCEIHLASNLVADVEKYNLGDFNINEPNSLEGAVFLEKQLVSDAEARRAYNLLVEKKADSHLVEWVSSHRSEEKQESKPVVLIAGLLNLLYTYYGDRKVVVANEQEKDPFVFLKMQLVWIGKTYEHTHWVNYDKVKKRLSDYLDELAYSERLLYPEHKDEFVDQCLFYFMRFPLIPEMIKETCLQYQAKMASVLSDKYDAEETDREPNSEKLSCGKDKLNGAFWSEKIAFEIRSVRKYPKAHPSGITCWKLVRLSEEEMNKKAANRLHNKAVQSAKRDETIERKKEAALEAKRKAYEEEQKKKNSFTVALLKGDKVFATHRAQVDLNPSDIE